MVNLGFFSSRLPNIEALKAKQDIKGLIGLLDHRDIDIQWQSADALGSMGTNATMPLLEVFTHRNPTVKIGAIEALGAIHDQRSCNPLITLLEHDRNTEVRWVAALALGSLGNPDAISPLARTLKDKDRYVRYGAALALHALSWVPQTDTDKAYYSIALQDWKQVTQIGAGATGPLIDILRDTDATTRAEVVDALGEIGDTSSQKVFEQVLKDPSSAVRWKAILAAKKCGVPTPRLPRGLSRRPRTGQNPWAAAILNFLFLGMGYNYLGYWWGFLVFMSYMSVIVLSQMQLGPFIPYLIAYPVTALFAVQTFFLAKRKEHM